MRSLSSLAKCLGIDRAALSHGFRLALSSWLAFSIAVLLHVQNPYWAAMPAWVVAQSTRGLLLERGVFRVLGTLGGAAFGLLLLHLTHAPYLQMVLLGLWIAICAAMTHVLRGVHAYGAMLCGITGAVVVLPSLLDPSQSLEIAIARIDCTLIGVMVVTLVTSWFTPGSERLVFYRRVRRLAGDAVDFAAGALKGEPRAQLEKQLLAQISEVEAAASLVSAGSLDGYRRLRHVHALVYASIELMAASQSMEGTPACEALSIKLRTLADTLRKEEPARIPNTAWTVAIDAAGPASERMSRALTQLMAAELALFTDPESSDAKSFGSKFVYLAPHYDWAMAAKIGLTCGLSAFATAALAKLSGWGAGHLAALGVCIFGMILSVAPLPRKLAPKMTAGVIAGVLLATLYRLWLQPQLTNSWLILLSVAPFLLLGGLARVHPKTAASGLDATMCFLLGSQAGLHAAQLPVILNGAAALVLGSLAVTVAITLKAKRPDRHAREVARQVCEDLDQLLGQVKGSTQEWNPQAARQILRLMIHLGRAGELGDKAPQGLLSVINLGHSIVELKNLAEDHELSSAERAHVAKGLERLAHFRNTPAGIIIELETLAAELATSPTPSVAALALTKAARALETSTPLITFANGLEAQTSALPSLRPAA